MLKGKPVRTTNPTDHPPRTEYHSTFTQHENGEGEFLRFLTGDGREFGFPFAQLLQFVLEVNPEPNPDAPQRLILAFSSHDVSIIGCRLHLLCEHLDQHRAIRIKTEDSRFANLEREKAFLVGISIMPVAAG